MNSSDFRQEARNKLKGKWGKVALPTFLFFLIMFGIGFLLGLLNLNDSIGSIVSIIIEIPLTFGLTIAFLKIFNSEDSDVMDFLTLGFKNFGRAWKVYFATLLKLIVPIIFAIVAYFMMFVGLGGAIGASAAAATSAELAQAGSIVLLVFLIIGILGILLLIGASVWLTIKSLYYVLGILIAIENPNITATEAVTKSKELMEGKRASYFVLQLTFIGWVILAILTLGIGYIWLLPYIMFAQIAFYKYALSNKSSQKTEIEKQEQSDNTESDA